MIREVTKDGKNSSAGILSWLEVFQSAAGIKRGRGRSDALRAEQQRLEQIPHTLRATSPLPVVAPEGSHVQINLDIEVDAYGPYNVMTNDSVLSLVPD